eukprot:1673310-Amphidinium_carterae.3
MRGSFRVYMERPRHDALVRFRYCMPRPLAIGTRKEIGQRAVLETTCGMEAIVLNVRWVHTCRCGNWQHAYSEEQC